MQSLEFRRSLVQLFGGKILLIPRKCRTRSVTNGKWREDSVKGTRGKYTIARKDVTK